LELFDLDFFDAVADDINTDSDRDEGIDGDYDLLK
jgi:hypothetical protein